MPLHIVGATPSPSDTGLGNPTYVLTSRDNEDYRIEFTEPVAQVALEVQRLAACMPATAGERTTFTALRAYAANGSVIAFDEASFSTAPTLADNNHRRLLTVVGDGAITAVETENAGACALAIVAVQYTRNSSHPTARAPDVSRISCAPTDTNAMVELNTDRTDGTTYYWTHADNGQLLATGAAATVALAPGVHSLSLTASVNGQTTLTDEFQVIIETDTAPMFDSGNEGPVMLECGEDISDSISARLNAPMTVSDACDDVEYQITPPAFNPHQVGKQQLHFTAVDSLGQESIHERSVVVTDTNAPTVEVGEMLQFYPPDNEYINLTLADCAQALDSCEQELDINAYGQIVAMSSDEPDVLPGHPNDPADDMVPLDASSFQVRNQRDGSRNGRVYAIDFVVTDPSGNRSDVHTCYVGIKIFDDGGCYDIPERDAPESELPLLCQPGPAPIGEADPSCRATPEVGTFNPVLEWNIRDWAQYSNYNQIMAAPIVASLNDDNEDGLIDDDDIPDILAVFFRSNGYRGDGVLRAVSGDGSTVHFSVSGLAGATGIAAGDIDGDGVVEIIASRGDARPIAFEHDGTLKWIASVSASGSYNAPSIADMDSDGEPEIIVGNTIYHADGSVRASAGLGARTSIAADLDNDGTMELVAGNSAHDPNGAVIWNNGAPNGHPAIADFDGDGDPEIAVSGNGRVRLQDHLGNILWNHPHPGGGTGGTPTVADFDGDGAPEIGVAARSLYAVFDGDGSILWQRTTQDASSSITGSSVYDFEGDGIADVVYADELYLWVYSGTDGAVKLQWDQHSSGTLIEYPLVVDVDGDDQAEIVLVSNDYAFHKARGISVIGDMDQSWRNARRIWNQHAYHITNVNDDGTIPTSAAASWTQNNSFRSGDLAPSDGSLTPDLVVQGQLCDDECAADVQVVFAYLGNRGASPLSNAATIELYGVTGSNEILLDTVTWSQVLAAGAFTPGLRLESEPVSYQGYVLRVSTNDAECDVTNNEFSIDVTDDCETCL